MKKGFMIGLSIVLFSLILLMIQDRRDMSGDLQIKGNWTNDADCLRSMFLSCENRRKSYKFEK